MCLHMCLLCLLLPLNMVKGLTENQNIKAQRLQQAPYILIPVIEQLAVIWSDKQNVSSELVLFLKAWFPKWTGHYVFLKVVE